MDIDYGKINGFEIIGKTPPVGVLEFWGGRITQPHGVKRPISVFFFNLNKLARAQIFSKMTVEIDSLES